MDIDKKNLIQNAKLRTIYKNLLFKRLVIEILKHAVNTPLNLKLGVVIKPCGLKKTHEKNRFSHRRVRFDTQFVGNGGETDSAASILKSRRKQFQLYKRALKRTLTWARKSDVFSAAAWGK